MSPESSSSALRPAIGGLAIAFALTFASLLLAASHGAPYLSLGDLNPWLVVFAASLLASLCVLPFAISSVITAYRSDGTKSWEPALMIWGALGALAAIAGFLLAAGADWSTASSMAAAGGLILLIEAGPIALGVLTWMVGD